MSKIRIGIVDDHQAIAQGIAFELGKNTDFEIAFTVFEKSEIIPTLKNNLPNMLIMDVVMPGSTGIESFKEVITNFPQLKVIAYTALNSPMMIEMLLRTGVKGYINKNQPLTDLSEAVFNVYYERIHLPEAYQFILNKLKSNSQNESLSKREIEILELIVAEKKSPEIAELLNISLNTVETHRRHLFEKLNVSNLAGLIKAGINQGYIK